MIELYKYGVSAQTEIDVGNPDNGNGGIGNGSGKEDKTAPQGCTVQGNSNENQVNIY